LPDYAERSRQRTLDLPLADASVTCLLERADQISRARLLASRQRESGLWLHALPLPAFGTLLDPETFRVAVTLMWRAVLPIYAGAVR